MTSSKTDTATQLSASAVCPTERIKVSVAALFLFLFVLTTTSALYSQPSESSCSRKAGMRKANGKLAERNAKSAVGSLAA